MCNFKSIIGVYLKVIGRYILLFSFRDSIDNEDKSGELDEVEWKVFDERKVNRVEIKSEVL